MSSLASTADVVVTVSGARLGGGGSCGSYREQKLDDERGWKDELDTPRCWMPPNY
jgi:hypothetical protein